jgi:hypothetical protein
MDTKSRRDLHAVTSEGRPGDDQSGRPPSLGKFIRELRKRKVCRASITYVLILWLNLQVADVMLPMMGLPDWTLHFVMFVGIMGLPVVLLLAWIFQITPNGLELDLGPERTEGATDRYLEPAVSVLLLMMSFALTLLLTIQFLGSPTQQAAAATEQSVASSLTHTGAADCAPIEG